MGGSSGGGEQNVAVRYELLAEIATGGMATVYLGRQRGEHGFSRTVAVKSMHPHYAKDESFRSMFLDEASLSGRIRHPNVVATLDVASSTDKLLLVMEYVEGVSLATLLRMARERNVRLELPIVSAIGSDLLSGLHAAHELQGDDGAPLGVVHRDVSPQNVMVGIDGLSRVLDFGVAKASGMRHVTVTGEVKGKLGYMAPEQIFGETVDRTSDIYAVGVVLWEALTGRRLFDANNEGHLIRQVSEGRISPPSRYVDDLPSGLSELVMRALASDRAERFATADEMRRALVAIVPPASREQVGALVKDWADPELATRREVMRSGTRKLEGDARAVLDVLTRTTKVEGTGTERKKRARVVAAIAGVAVLGGVIATAGAMRGTANSSTSTSTTTTTPAAEPPVGQPSAAVVRPPSSPDPAPPPASAPTPTPAPPAAEPPVGQPSAAVASPPSSRKTPRDAAIDCTVPYVVDPDGHRHYRAECFPGTR